jgi:hypothetical protein
VGAGVAAADELGGGFTEEKEEKKKVRRRTLSWASLHTSSASWHL